MKKLFALVVALTLACAFAGSALAIEAIPADEIKVGFLYLDDASDKGYTLAHHEGTLAMQEALRLRDDQILIKTFITEDSACEDAMLELIEQGCNVIFGTSFGYGTYMAELAEEYPEVVFLHCSGNLSNDVNFANYFGRIWEARYLAGIARGAAHAEQSPGLCGRDADSRVHLLDERLLPGRAQRQPGRDDGRAVYQHLV